MPWRRSSDIPMAEVYEVATFYAHFDVVGDKEARPPKVTIRVCDSLSCMLAGAEKLIAELEAERLPEVRVVRAPCVGACDVAPAAEVGHHHVRPRQRGQAEEPGARRPRASRDARLPGLRRLYQGWRLRRAARLRLRQRARWRT